MKIINRMHSTRVRHPLCLTLNTQFGWHGKCCIFSYVPHATIRFMRNQMVWWVNGTSILTYFVWCAKKRFNGNRVHRIGRGSEMHASSTSIWSMLTAECTAIKNCRSDTNATPRRSIFGIHRNKFVWNTYPPSTSDVNIPDWHMQHWIYDYYYFMLSPRGGYVIQRKLSFRPVN